MNMSTLETNDVGGGPWRLLTTPDEEIQIPPPTPPPQLRLLGLVFSPLSELRFHWAVAIALP